MADQIEASTHSHSKIEDRLSSLPDEILSHILSFIPSNYSIKTSILAARFRHLWKSVPILDFRDSLCLRPQHAFEKLMDEALNNHESLSRVRLLRLRCYHCRDSPFSMSRWNGASATATSFKLEEVDIYLNPRNRDGGFELPSTMFSCHNLKTLRLCGNVIIHDNYISPPDQDQDHHVGFPCLKTLWLESVIFTGINALNKLIFDSPSLEVIHIQDEYCRFGQKKNAAIGPVDHDHDHDRVSFPYLKTLWLEFISFRCASALTKLLFGSPSLQVIHIRGCDRPIIAAPVDVDDHVFFPCLKTLWLESISFRGASALNKLLISNPEIIHIRHCQLETSDRIQDWSLLVTSNLTRPLRIKTGSSYQCSCEDQEWYWSQRISMYSEKKDKK